MGADLKKDKKTKKKNAGRDGVTAGSASQIRITAATGYRVPAMEVLCHTFSLFFLGLLPWHMEVPRLGV